jgi:hypothetical protein
MREKIEWPGVVQCLECKEVLVSNYTHDFKRCQCPNETMVDGGRAYLRCGGVDMRKVRVLKLSVAFDLKRKKK